jgi:Flp pilus assembly protein TadD
MLIEDGNLAEGKKEMEIASDLLNQSRLQDEASLTGKPMVQSTLTKTRIATHTEILEEDRVEAQLAPAIASSFNNLGVHAAMASEYVVASSYFKEVAEWEPTLAGVDHNWGQAAYEAHQYAAAIGPLSRYLVQHPQDAAIRAMLGLSEYLVDEYGDALQTLRPLENDLSFSPLLPLAYAESMAREGDSVQGAERLKAIVRVDPQNGAAHRGLAAAYRRSGQVADADREDRASKALSIERP